MTKRRACAVFHCHCWCCCCYILYLSDEINLKNVSIHVECYMINWSCRVYIYVRACACWCALSVSACYIAMCVYKFYFVFTNLLLWRCKEWNKFETIAFHARFLPCFLSSMCGSLPLSLPRMMQLLYLNLAASEKWNDVRFKPSIYLSIFIYFMIVFILRVLECNTMSCMYLSERKGNATKIPKNSWEKYTPNKEGEAQKRTVTWKRESMSKIPTFLRPERGKCLIPLFILGVKKRENKKCYFCCCRCCRCRCCCWIKSLFIVNKPPLYRERIHSLPFAYRS